MARLVLKFEGRTMDEYGLGLMVTIGRGPDNSLAIDNPSVSTHHACVFRDGDDFIVEDVGSTNGTFVNEKRVTRHRLQGGDLILIGKHTLLFDATGSGPTLDADGDQPTLAALGDTLFLDTKQHRALLAKLVRGQAHAGGDIGGAKTAAPARNPAVLRVLSGRTERSEYRLEALTSLIGKTDAALVRLKGWFKPAVAVAIGRTSEGYVATAMSGRALINGKRMKGRRELKDGDVLRVSGLTLEFRLVDASRDKSRPSPN